MKPFLIVLSALLLIGCATQQKKEQKQREGAKIFFQTHPEELAKLCDDTFPIPEYEYTEGNTIVEYDTIYKEGVILPCPEPTKENPKPSVKCPETKTIYKNVYKTDTIKIVDSRKELIVKSENELLKAELKAEKEKANELALEVEKQKKTKNHYLWALIVVGVIFLAYIVFKVYSKIYVK